MPGQLSDDGGRSASVLRPSDSDATAYGPVSAQLIPVSAPLMPAVVRRWRALGIRSQLMLAYGSVAVLAYGLMTLIAFAGVYSVRDTILKTSRTALLTQVRDLQTRLAQESGAVFEARLHTGVSSFVLPAVYLSWDARSWPEASPTTAQTNACAALTASACATAEECTYKPASHAACGIPESCTPNTGGFPLTPLATQWDHPELNGQTSGDDPLGDSARRFGQREVTVNASSTYGAEAPGSLSSTLTQCVWPVDLTGE